MEHNLINRQAVLQILKQLQIPFKLYQHDAVLNMNQMKEKVKLDKAPLVKNLFYADKKPDTFYLVIAETQTKLDKGFWKEFGTSHNNTRFAKQDQLQEILKTKLGSVNPFALANDSKKVVKYLIIDQLLYKFDHWAFHPMDNTASVQIAREDFFKFINHFKIEHKKVDLTLPKQQKKEQKKQKQTAQKQAQKNPLDVQASKTEKFSEWYPQVLIKAQMLEYYNVSGCYILRPWSFGIWQRIQKFFDALIKQNGVQNASFPLFVSKKSLETQKDHVQGFAAQVAWVTKSGKSDLAQPIAIRPTSQTIMYPAYANWIKSHRDLPLKLNQWTNVVRWEFKHPTPFIRTRQFLWQQGHTAHVSKQEAIGEMLTNLQFYRRVYEQLLAVPVMKGMKTKSQRFAGGDQTSTVQTWIPQNGRAIQSATSHNLGQNFAKMFGIEFQNDKKQKQYAWQTSWGLTTRSIGIMVMYHGDNKGLVLPPKVANTQVVIVPVPFKGKQQMIYKQSEQIYKRIKAAKIRVHLDSRDNYNPGWKYNHWQLKGVPIRLELGPKDIEKKQIKCVIRMNGQKMQIKWQTLQKDIEELLQKIQNDMLAIARQKFNDKLKQASTWQEFMTHLNNRNVVLVPWCQNETCQQKIKERSGKQTKEGLFEADNSLTGNAKTLCVPLDHKPLGNDQKCFHCNEIAKVRVIWGRSY